MILESPGLYSSCIGEIELSPKKYFHKLLFIPVQILHYALEQKRFDDSFWYSVYFFFTENMYNVSFFSHPKICSILIDFWKLSKYVQI